MKTNGFILLNFNHLFHWNSVVRSRFSMLVRFVLYLLKLSEKAATTTTRTARFGFLFCFRFGWLLLLVVGCRHKQKRFLNGSALAYWQVPLDLLSFSPKKTVLFPSQHWSIDVFGVDFVWHLLMWLLPQT